MVAGRCCLLLLGVLVAAGSAVGQTDTSWLVGEPGEWNDPGNWSDGVPNNNGETFNAIVAVDGVAGEYVVTLDVNATIDGLQLVNGDATLNGLSGFGLDVLEQITLTESTIEALAFLMSQGEMTFDTAAPFCDVLCDVPISHTGTEVLWQGTGGIDLLGTTEFVHAVGSTFSVLSDAVMTLDAPAIFRNEGTILKTSAMTTTIDGGLGGTFQNPGTVDLNAGTLSTDALEVPNDALVEGTWIVRDTATLDLVNETILTNEAIVTLSGPTAAFPAFSSISTNAPPGSISVLDGQAFLTTGPVLNMGTIFVGAGSSFSQPPGPPLMNLGGQLRGNGVVGAPVANGGTTAPGASAGVLTVVAPDQGFFQLPEGTVEIELGGLVQGVEYDLLAIKGILQFQDGSAGVLLVQLINSFVPVVGDSFVVITCANLPLGQFAEVIAPNLPCDLELLVFYEPGQVRLEIAEACLADCNGDGNLDMLDFVCFQEEWVNQSPCGDCDGNGEFNILDFICFQNAWIGGCP